MKQDFDENDNPWATWEMLAIAGLLVFLFTAGILAWSWWVG